MSWSGYVHDMLSKTEVAVYGFQMLK